MLTNLLAQAVSSGKPFVILKNGLSNVPSIKQIYEFKDNAERNNTIRSDVSKVYIMHCPEVSDLYGYGDFKILSNAVKDVFRSIGEYENVGAGVLLTEVTRDESPISGLPSHSDQTNQIHWACQGQAEWQIAVDDEIKSYLVEPGDILYIRKGTIHNVESITPRASIVMSVGRELEGYEREKNHYAK